MLRNRKPIDMAGQRIGRLLVVSARRDDAADAWFWFCHCDCGNTKWIRAQCLRNGDAQSCGCLGREALLRNAAKAKTHGESHKHSPEYFSWQNMIQRCVNPRHKDYYLYGARGICVCERWRHSFETFLRDMGRRPTLLHTLDRIDSNGPYSPENCRWATRREQMQNRRPYSEWTRAK